MHNNILIISFIIFLIGIMVNLILANDVTGVAILSILTFITAIIVKRFDDIEELLNEMQRGD